MHLIYAGEERQIELINLAKSGKDAIDSYIRAATDDMLRDIIERAPAAESKLIRAANLVRYAKIEAEIALAGRIHKRKIERGDDGRYRVTENKNGDAVKLTGAERERNRKLRQLPATRAERRVVFDECQHREELYSKEALKKARKRDETQEKIHRRKARIMPADVVNIYATDTRYRVVYADPPWAYTTGQHAGAGKGEVSGAAHEYPTMPLHKICALPVRDITEPNAVLFLWATAPLMFLAGQVIEAWGFTYKTHFVWNKLKHNVGYYSSVRHEDLLVASRGSCTPDSNTLEPSVIEIERTEHSRKPNEFRQMIDRMYQYGNRIELFAREQVNGWDYWGNEIHAQREQVIA